MSQRRVLRSNAAAATPPVASTSSQQARPSRASPATRAVRRNREDDTTQRSQVQASGSTSQRSSQFSNPQVDDDSSGDEMEGYSDLHRLVLQGVMSAGWMDAKGVKKLFQESSKYLKRQIPTEIYPYIQKVVREINERIKQLDMMIRSATCEITGEKFYVFLVTLEKPIMKMQTYFSKPELELFQKIMDCILRKHSNFLISTTECINIQSEMDTRSFTKVHAEEFLEKLVKMKYFTKVYKDSDKDMEDENPEYDITLGFRTIREYEPLLREVYGDIFGNCGLCKMILLNGLQCPKCPVVVHRACAKKYIKSCRSCMSCQCTWKNENALTVRKRSVEDNMTQEEEEEEPAENDDVSQVGPNQTADSDVDMEPARPGTSGTQGSIKQAKKKPSAPTRSSKRKARKPSSEESESD